MGYMDHKKLNMQSISISLFGEKYENKTQTNKWKGLKYREDAHQVTLCKYYGLKQFVENQNYTYQIT